MASELVLDHVEVVERVAAGLDAGRVEHVHQRGAALDVAQELVAQTTTLAGALDQPGTSATVNVMSPAVTTRGSGPGW